MKPRLWQYPHVLKRKLTGVFSLLAKDHWLIIAE
jgi:hypothetical protein